MNERKKKQKTQVDFKEKRPATTRICWQRVMQSKAKNPGNLSPEIALKSFSRNANHKKTEQSES
ncbi:MAG: hypothetical protein ACP5M4_04360 [Acidobacteriaceae bacterium]